MQLLSKHGLHPSQESTQDAWNNFSSSSKCSCTSFMIFRASWLKRESTGFISISRVYVYLSWFPLSKCILAPGVARPARLIGCLPCIPNALVQSPAPSKQAQRHKPIISALRRLEKEDQKLRVSLTA